MPVEGSGFGAWQWLLSSTVGSDATSYSEHPDAVATSTVTHGGRGCGGIFLNEHM